MSRAVLLAIGLSALACSEPTPHITDLTYSPNAGVVGEAEDIVGQVTYRDGDGNISQGQFLLIAPGTGTTFMDLPRPIGDVEMGSSGYVVFRIPFQPDVEGMWGLEIWIFDLDGNESNHLSGRLRVAGP